MTNHGYRWIFAPADPLVASLADDLRIPTSLAQVLMNRGFSDAESAKRFLHPQLRQLSDPFDLPDMAAAVDCILDAIEQKQRIVIYGDYDVDGITSSALLLRVLRCAGATVENFLPHRMDEGYGLSQDGIARCLAERKPELLIAVDCGTSSVSEIAALKRRGVETIVLDHHEPPERLPGCVALVNPKRIRRDIRVTDFASVGVSFKLAHALQKRGRERGLPWARELDLREHLDLVAVGTVADIVPVTGENRILVKAGLDRLPATQKIGLRALMDLADVPDRVNPYHIGFRIGPRLNAAGRLGDAMVALELLLTVDPDKAGQLARLLNESNTQRQQIEARIVEEARAQARERPIDRVLVLASDNWHIGVIGIVASRIQQEFCRPTVVIGIENGMGKGSCRSVAGFSMVAALAHGASLLDRFGGHDMAAGLSVKAHNINELRSALNEYAANAMADDDVRQQIRIDAVIRLNELDKNFFAHLERFEPCGPENPTPVFAAQGVRLRGGPQVFGKGHLKFHVTDGETTVAAVWWGMGDRQLPSGDLDVAFVPEQDRYRGEPTAQLRMKDVQPGKHRER